MKLEGRTYRVLFDAHAWAGALASVLLVGMFLLGIVSLFHDELAPWAEPRLRKTPLVEEPVMLATLQGWLDARTGPEAPKRIDVDLPNEHLRWIRAEWKDAEGAEHAQLIHPSTGEIANERSDLGHFLFLLHFLYPLPNGMLVAGLLATLLLLVVVSGFSLQLGRFWRELVRFRPRETLRSVWSDLHKVLGSIGTPYQAMIAWTAAIICLNATVLQPVVVHTAYDGNLDAGLASIGYPRGPKATREPGAAPDVKAVLARARGALPDAHHYRLSIRNLGDAATHIDVRGRAKEGLHAFTTVRVSGAGAVLHVREAGGPGLTSQLLESAYLLHSGIYGGFGLRLAYALLGLFSALCVVTGNLLWLEKRARATKRTFDIALARLTAGGSGGAAIAIAAIFLANQLLPETVEQRPSWEHSTFYAAWLLSVGGALLHRHPALLTQQMLVGAGAVLVLMPLLDGWRNARVPFSGGVTPVLWTELALVLFGASLIVSAGIVRRITRPVVAPVAIDAAVAA